MIEGTYSNQNNYRRTVIADGLDTVEVRFDVYKNALWTGNVNRIRFDPFNMTAPFEIDYIRLYKLTDK